MFYKKDLSNYRQPLDGVTYKALTYGAKTLLSEFRLQKGYSIPIHKHPHEQITNVIKGQLQFTLGEETRICKAGEVITIPSNTLHAAKAITKCRAIDIFYPVREEYKVKK